MGTPYTDEPGSDSPAPEQTTSQAKATMSAARYGDGIKVMLQLELPEGFHAYAPGASDGLPLALSLGKGFDAIENFKLLASGVHLSGNVWLMFTTRGDADELVASLRVQLCDDLTCLAPQTLELRCLIQAAGQRSLD